MKIVLLAVFLCMASAGHGLTQSAPAAPTLEHELQQTVITHVEFRSTTLSDAVEYLRQEGARISGDQFNIFLKTKVGTGTTTKLSLTLDHIPLSEALHYIAVAANLDMEIQQYAVVLTEKGLTPPAPQATSVTVDPAAFDHAVQESRAHANAKYPDLLRNSTQLYAKVTATLKHWQTSNPDFFKRSNWPEQLADACADDLVKNPPLYTADDVKAYWVKNLRHPRTLDPDCASVTSQNSTFLAALNAGQLNDDAQDQADGLNIPLLTKAGRFLEAQVLQRNRAQYQQKLADAAAAEDRQKALAQQKAADDATLAELRGQASAARAAASQAQTQNDQLRNQLFQQMVQNPQPGASAGP